MRVGRYGGGWGVKSKGKTKRRQHVQFSLSKGKSAQLPSLARFFFLEEHEEEDSKGSKDN